VIQWPV